MTRLRLAMPPAPKYTPPAGYDHAAIVRDDNEWFEERASILEYDGGQPRKAAEMSALREWREWKDKQ